MKTSAERIAVYLGFCRHRVATRYQDIAAGKIPGVVVMIARRDRLVSLSEISCA